jgi:hypothetical protein
MVMKMTVNFAFVSERSCQKCVCARACVRAQRGMEGICRKCHLHYFTVFCTGVWGKVPELPSEERIFLGQKTCRVKLYKS